MGGSNGSSAMFGMGGSMLSGGGGKGGSTNTTTTNTSNPPAAVQDAYRALIDRGTNVANTPYQAYQGQQIAPISPMAQQGLQSIQNAQGIATPYYNSAQQYANQSAQPTWQDIPQFSADNIQKYMSPYQQNVIDTTMANINQNNAIQQQQLMGKAIDSGASPFGGDRAGVAAAELARQQNLASGQTIAGLQNQNYSQAMGQFNTQQQLQMQGQQTDAERQAQAAYLMGGLGQQAEGTALNGAQAQLTGGALQQQQAQNELDSQYQQWQQQQAYPFETTQFLAGLTTGVGSQMGGTSTSTQGPAGGGSGGKTSAAQGVLGGAMTGASYGSYFGPYGMAAGAVLGGGLGYYNSRADGGRISYAPGGSVPSWVPVINLPLGNTIPKAPDLSTTTPGKQIDMSEISKMLGSASDNMQNYDANNSDGSSSYFPDYSYSPSTSTASADNFWGADNSAAQLNVPNDTYGLNNPPPTDKFVLPEYTGTAPTTGYMPKTAGLAKMKDWMSSRSYPTFANGGRANAYAPGGEVPWIPVVNISHGSTLPDAPKDKPADSGGGMDLGALMKTGMQGYQMYQSMGGGAGGGMGAMAAAKNGGRICYADGGEVDDEALTDNIGVNLNQQMPAPSTSDTTLPAHTAPTPQNNDGSFESYASKLRMPMLAAGLTMLASPRDQSFNQSIGHAGIAGLGAYASQESAKRDAAKEAQKEAADAQKEKALEAYRTGLLNKPVSVGAGDTLIDPRTGNAVFTAPKKVEEGSYNMVAGMGTDNNGNSVPGSYIFNKRTGQSEFKAGVITGKNAIGGKNDPMKDLRDQSNAQFEAARNAADLSKEFMAQIKQAPRTGITSPFQQSAASVLQQFTGPGQMANTATALDTAQKLGVQTAFANMAKLKGARPGIGMLKLSSKGGPEITKTPEANQNISDLSQAAANAAGEQAKLVNNWQGTPQAANDLLDEYYKDNPGVVTDANGVDRPNLTAEPIDKWLAEKKGMDLKGNKITNTSTTQSPSINTKAQFDALPSGSTYTGKDGKLYRKP